MLKFLFHHFYRSFAWTYDFVAAAVSVGRWAGWRLEALPHVNGPAVLEIGFGTGHLQVELHKQGFRAFGLDESPQMAALTRRRLLHHQLIPALTRGRAQALPFASCSLNTILSTFPSEYILDGHSLAEIFRVLRPSGRLVVVPMAWIGGRSLPDRLAKFLFRVTGQTPEPPHKLGTGIQASLKQAGFETQISFAELRGSTVMLVIAAKPAGPGEGSTSR